MLFQIIIFILSSLILCMPIVFWMYVFTRISSRISRLFFFLGITLGGVIAFLFSRGFSFVFFSVPLMTVLESFSGTFSLKNFITWATIFLGIMLLCFVVFWVILYLRKNKQAKKIFFPSVLHIVGFIFIISIGIQSLIYFFPQTSSQIFESRYITLLSFGSIAGYYILIACIEEFLKYYGNMSLIPEMYINRNQEILAGGVSIALGFAFFENVLYFYTYLQTNLIDTSVIGFVFLRSIFTVSLHVFGSLLMGKAFLSVFRNVRFFIIYFFIFAFLSVIFHSLFNLSLHYDLVGILFFYVFFLYITMIFLFPTQEEKISDLALRI